METGKTSIGVIGCGFISGVYLEVMRGFKFLEILSCADIEMDRARLRAAQYGIPHAVSVEELLSDPRVEIVVNLTPPRAHAEVGLSVLTARKSVYNEKPLADSLEDGQLMLQLARDNSLRVAVAPDTLLGAGWQTCRQLLDRGAIGTPLAVNAFMLSAGPESWHPNPDFYYQKGGGPLLDMGPYYLSAIVSLLGPVRRVSGTTRISHPERTITSQPRRGERIPVDTPTHITAVLELVSGLIVTLVMSFDIQRSELPHMEIYGSHGTLSTPDPNTFGGPVRIWQMETGSWKEHGLNPGWTGNSRGLGVAELALAMRAERPHRTSGELGLHILEVMLGILQAGQEGTQVMIHSSCNRPEPLMETDIKELWDVAGV